MNVLDLLIIILLIFGFIRGILKGFVLGLSSLLGIVVSIYIAKYFTPLVIGIAESLFGIGQNISPAIGFLITFLVALLLFHFVALLINKFVELVALAWLNKLLGGMLVFVKYLLIISVFLNLFNYMNSRLEIVSDEKLQESKLYKPVKEIVPTVLPFISFDDVTSYNPSIVKQSPNE